MTAESLIAALYMGVCASFHKLSVVCKYIKSLSLWTSHTVIAISIQGNNKHFETTLKSGPKIHCIGLI